MKSWRARCIQIFCWMNNVIFHWVITINIYVKNICAVFRVKCEEWHVGCHRLSFLLAEYTGVIFTLTSHNITWFYYCNFDFILKIWHKSYLFSYLFEKDKRIKLALAAWYLKKKLKLEFNKHKMFQSYFWIKLIKKLNELMTTLLLKTKWKYLNGCNSSFVMLGRERETRAPVGLRWRILRSCRDLYSFPSSIKSSPD